jgi:hypothetical protein
MQRRRSINVKSYIRSVIVILLIAFWSAAFLSGWLLWFAPHGPRSGRIPLFLGLTKRGWGDLHFWLSLIASGITVVHVVVDWKALKGCLRYLASTHRTGIATARSSRNNAQTE